MEKGAVMKGTLFLILESPVMTGRRLQENRTFNTTMQQQEPEYRGARANTLQSPRLGEGRRWGKNSKKPVAPALKVIQSVSHLLCVC
jgi:hypothetical protein